ncbi:MAG: outer membrane protein assembly factor BamA, partial [candidate division NC10 bacterium]|nr:outer membrane protein assembly factor BamA [candidate division NC10 bacterium]
IDLPLGSIANPILLSQNAEKVRLFYEGEGYYQATVTPKVEPVSENEAKVIFSIQEGPEFEIDEIAFRGNQAFSDRKLKKQMKTKELLLYFFYGTLKTSELKADADRLKAFYLNNGYLDVKIGEPQVEINRETHKIRITIDIQEGPQFRVGRISLSGNTVFGTEDLLKNLSSKPNEVFSYEVLQRDLFLITDRYGEKGYIFADVSPLTDLDREKLLVNIKLNVEEGRQIRLERLEISGNDRTRDNVIRREFRIAEGDIYDSRAVRVGKEGLNYLGFFEEVKVDTAPGSSEDRLVLKLGVKEKLTGTFSLGGGYGSMDGLMAMGQIAESNLFGRGVRLSLSAEIAQRRTRFNLNFFDPRVYDTYNSAGFNLYNQERDFDQWREGRVGGDVTYGRPLYWLFEGYLTYRYERLNIFDLSKDAPQYVRDQRGRSSTSTLLFALVRDLRDSRIDPTKGSKSLASVQYAGGFLGGNNHFAKYEGDFSYYYPLFWKVVGVLHGNIGFAEGLGDQRLPVSERYFLGGPTTVRGYEFRDIGPVDENGEPYGGNKKLVFNAEIIFPLIENFKGVLFYDRGNAWEEGGHYSLSDMRQGVGVGLRFFSPLGPIRLEYGWKINPRKDESQGEFHFMVGAFF